MAAVMLFHVCPSCRLPASPPSACDVSSCLIHSTLVLVMEDEALGVQSEICRGICGVNVLKLTHYYCWGSDCTWMQWRWILRYIVTVDGSVSPLIVRVPRQMALT